MPFDGAHLAPMVATKLISLIAGRKKLGTPVPRAKVASLVGVVEATVLTAARAGKIAI